MLLRSRSLLTLALMLLAVAAYAWRCQFGMETYDEPYYLAPGFHSMALGDLPFVDEIHNAPRHYDILNYFLARPFLPYSVLSLRIAAVLLYAFLLLLYFAVCSRGALGILTAIVFGICLWFDYFLMPTWSHNWWVRNALLVHHLFFLLAWDKSVSDKLAVAISGVAMGVIVVAYNPLVPLLALGPALLFLLRRELVGAYLTGISVPLILDASYLTYYHLWNPWLSAFKDVLAVPDYSGNTTLGKAWGILNYLASQNILLGLLALPLCLCFNSLLAPLRFIAIGGVAAFFAYKFGISGQVDFVKGALSAWMVSGVLVLGLRSICTTDRRWLMPMLLSAAAGFGVAMSSHGGVHSLFWVVPSVAVPLSVFLADKARELNENGERSLARFAFTTLAIFYGALLWGTYRHQFRSCYRDVPIKQCTARLTAPPYQNLYTSPARAALVEKLYALLKDKKMVMAFPNLPGPFLFPQVRSSLDSTLVNFAFSTHLNWAALKKMAERKRYPEAIVFVKIEPWTWGMEKPNYLLSPVANPLFHFSECAKGKTLASLPEFEVYDVQQSKMQSCLRSVLNSSANFAKP